MMRKCKLFLSVVGVGFFFAACAPTSNLFVRDAELAKKTKKVAVLPFQDANLRASEDTSVQTLGNSLTLKFLAHAEPVLSGRYEFISQDLVMAELKKMGFEGYDSTKSLWRQAPPSGYTIPQALEVGKKLGADAIFLGQVAGLAEVKPAFSMSVRMLDVKTGKVIVAASAACGAGLNFTPWNAPMKKLVTRLSQEVPQ